MITSNDDEYDFDNDDVFLMKVAIMFITGTVCPLTSEILMILDNNDNDDDDGDDDGGGDDDDNYCRSIIVCTPASDNMLG